MDLAFWVSALKKEIQIVMRKRLLLTAICALSVMMTMAQNRTNPDVADYFIKGYLSIERGNDGKPVYKLSEIDNQGIYFEDPRATRFGEETDLEDVLFQFSRASTTYPGGINTPLDFWRYDNDIHEWQPDGETRQGTAGVEEKKSMVVMLVLDCSSSIGDDFVAVQEAAKAFIQSLYDASNGAGNIKLGIVSFSKINETQVFNIRPLTPDSFDDMTLFINRLSTQNGTALYYAMDKSIELMADYCNKSISSTEPLSAAVMVTFTDGLDQTSRDPEKDILTADAYYDEVLNKYGTKMQDVSINGVSLQHEIRGVKGNDIITDAQSGKFQKTGESLGNFMRLNNYSELGAAFRNIAQNLIDQWRVLNLYVPNSFSGRVAWTYPSNKKKNEVEEQKEPRQKSKVFFGINAGIGLSNCSVYKKIEHNKDNHGWGYSNENSYDNRSAVATIGLDLAFPIGKLVDLGLFTSIGYDGAWNNKLIVEGGLLMLVNFMNGGALYLGGGILFGRPVGSYTNVPENYEPDILSSVILGEKPYIPEIRLGYKFSNGLYFFAEYNHYYGNKVTGWAYREGHVLGCDVEGDSYLFHIGYSF